MTLTCSTLYTTLHSYDTASMPGLENLTLAISFPCSRYSFESAIQRKPRPQALSPFAHSCTCTCTCNNFHGTVWVQRSYTFYFAQGGEPGDETTYMYMYTCVTLCISKCLGSWHIQCTCMYTYMCELTCTPSFCSVKTWILRVYMYMHVHVTLCTIPVTWRSQIQASFFCFSWLPSSAFFYFSWMLPPRTTSSKSLRLF